MKKYELTDITKTENIFGKPVTLHRIRALKDFGDVKAGEFGGWVEHEGNLSQSDNCWLYDEGTVCGNGKVSDCGVVCDHGAVSDNGIVRGHGMVYKYGRIFDNGKLFDNGEVYDHGVVSGNGVVCDYGVVSGNGWVCGRGVVQNHGVVSDYGIVCDYSVVSGNGMVCGNGMVSGNGRVSGNCVISGDGEIFKPEQVLTVGPIGSRNDYTTFYRAKDSRIWVTCGCFCGSLEDFARKVEETHGDTKYGITYKQAIDLARSQIELC